MSIVMLIRDLTADERPKMIDGLTGQEFEIPYSGKKTLSRATIYKWLREFSEAEDVGNALMPKVRCDRGKQRVLTQDQKNALLRWRSDNKYRTCSQLLEELLANNLAGADNFPSEATIARFLKSAGLDRRTLVKIGKPDGKVRLAFEAEYPNQIWMMDTKGPNLNVKDPLNEGRTVIAKPIVAIDDYSRYIVAVLYIYEGQETEDTILHLLKNAISRYGACDILYCDRGGPYMGKKLKRTMELIGCKVMHTQKRDAAAKGKSERIMQYFYEKIDSEVMSASTVCTIEQVNQYLNALLTMDYHNEVHSVTSEKPGERYFGFPGKYRRFVSDEAISKIFLPCAKSYVSKTGLVRRDKKDYLVPDASLNGTHVEVRWDPSDSQKVYVWSKDKYIGEAFRYIAENDFLKREMLKEAIKPARPVEIPSLDDVPAYNYLEHKLMAYRQEMEKFKSINDELIGLRKKQAETKAELLRPCDIKPVQGNEGAPGSFDAGRLIHLLSVLLRRKLSAQERLAVHLCWQKYGPFGEKTVRGVVGRLLGENHPVSDLTGYMDEIRINSLKGEDKK
jgi:transposase InsO family protein